MNEAAVVTKKKQVRRDRGQQLQVRSWDELGTAELEEKLGEMERQRQRAAEAEAEADAIAEENSARVVRFGTKLSDKLPALNETEVFVGNLPYSATTRTVRALFPGARYVNLLYDDQGKMKGFGYIDFHTVKDAENALKQHLKLQMGQRTLKVERRVASDDDHDARKSSSGKSRKAPPLGLYSLKQGAVSFDSGELTPQGMLSRAGGDDRMPSTAGPFSRTLFGSREQVDLAPPRAEIRFGASVQSAVPPARTPGAMLSRDTFATAEGPPTGRLPAAFSRDDFGSKDVSPEVSRSGRDSPQPMRLGGTVIRPQPPRRQGSQETKGTPGASAGFSREAFGSMQSSGDPSAAQNKRETAADRLNERNFENNNTSKESEKQHRGTVGKIITKVRDVFRSNTSERKNYSEELNEPNQKSMTNVDATFHKAMTKQFDTVSLHPRSKENPDTEGV
mmetsp:Transcript_22137/g.30413  ORF Transcript_22137/g.30413 Transcript_22137/m.30413 type:complete len:449 (+) Transcript_22137:61-1407(+)